MKTLLLILITAVAAQAQTVFSRTHMYTIDSSAVRFYSITISDSTGIVAYREGKRPWTILDAERALNVLIKEYCPYCPKYYPVKRDAVTYPTLMMPNVISSEYLAQYFADKKPNK